MDLDLEKPCVCTPSNCTGSGVCQTWLLGQCQCMRPGNPGKTWLFSRPTTGWWCGIHADWTELTSCVDRYFDFKEEKSERRYFYLTILRDPVKRFISEFKFVQHGAVWELGMEKHVCNGRQPLPEELPKCYTGSDWRSVQIEEFLAQLLARPSVSTCCPERAPCHPRSVLIDPWRQYCSTPLTSPGAPQFSALCCSSKAGTN